MITFQAPKTLVKLPAHRAALPGKVMSFYIVPLDPAYPAGAGHVPVRTFHNAPRSKALESVWLFRPHGHLIPTQSLNGESESIVFSYLASEKSNFLPGEMEAMACL